MSIKGVKVFNNSNATSNNNFINSPTKIRAFENVIGEYERTKNLNRELLKNVGTPKVPAYSRTQIGGTRLY